MRSKLREAKLCGIEVQVKCFDKNISEAELLGKVMQINNDAGVDGILLQVSEEKQCTSARSMSDIGDQLPLPSHIHEQTICQALSHEKDVDSLHKENLGLLSIPQATPLFVPCTAQGEFTRQRL